MIAPVGSDVWSKTKFLSPFTQKMVDKETRNRRSAHTAPTPKMNWMNVVLSQTRYVRIPVVVLKIPRKKFLLGNVVT